MDKEEKIGAELLVEHTEKGVKGIIMRCMIVVIISTKNSREKRVLTHGYNTL